MTRRATWVVPAVLAAAVTGYLAWGAWVSAADNQWLYLTQAWWRAWLRPGSLQAPLALIALWLAALLCYWWPRRLQSQLVGLTIVVTMVVIGGVLDLRGADSVPGRPERGRGSGLDARPVRRQSARLPARRLPRAAVAGLAVWRGHQHGGDPGGSAGGGGRAVAAAAGPAMGPAGLGCHRPGWPGRLDAAAAAAAGSDPVARAGIVVIGPGTAATRCWRRPARLAPGS